MSLVFFEGFEHYSNYTDVSGVLEMPCNMADDSRTISPVFSTGVDGIEAKNSGTMLLMESSHQAGTATNGQYLAFFPSVAFDLQENLTEGIVGFAYRPVLPAGGTFGDGNLSFTPIACLTDEDYKPHFFICMTSTGQIQLRKYMGVSTYKAIDSANVTNNVQTYPRFLRSTSNSTLTIGGGLTNLPLITQSSLDANRVYEDYWNYLELQFSFNDPKLILRINRSETSSRNDIELQDVDPDEYVQGLYGSPTGSGTQASPMRIFNPDWQSGGGNNISGFRVLVPGTAYLTGNWGTANATFNVEHSLYKNGVAFHTINSSSAQTITRSIPVVSGDILGAAGGFGLQYQEVYIVKDTGSALFSQQVNPSVRHLVLGTFWGHKEGNISPAADLHWKTLVDDIYCINTSGNIAPSGFLGTVSCRRVPYDQEISNTTASGNLASISEPFAGSGSFKLPAGNGAVFFDNIDQEFFVKLNQFDAESEEIIAIQTLFNGYTLNSENYVGLSLEIANGSGSLDFEEVQLSTDSKFGGMQSRIYATDPSGNPWTEDSVRNTTFKLKSFS